ncbi:hypothetical protein ECC02_009562 [Trypanosoma cruzi]|uniref:Uncharacterized protein n=1 Tax=Trypanosoma cruzi TaxID=5693 RepID=A0A7J6XTK7_TRYCR|nr:hypothetical protein ECC02_009547 [Trypanosoma cruzi]KAF5217560.1 hypothetical protein ECC02_009562 [Trypanosoma cruzi]
MLRSPTSPASRGPSRSPRSVPPCINRCLRSGSSSARPSRGAVRETTPLRPRMPTGGTTLVSPVIAATAVSSPAPVCSPPSSRALSMVSKAVFAATSAAGVSIPRSPPFCLRRAMPFIVASHRNSSASAWRLRSCCSIKRRTRRIVSVLIPSSRSGRDRSGNPNSGSHFPLPEKKILWRGTTPCCCVRQTKPTRVRCVWPPRAVSCGLHVHAHRQRGHVVDGEPFHHAGSRHIESPLVEWVTLRPPCVPSVAHSYSVPIWAN